MLAILAAGFPMYFVWRRFVRFDTGHSRPTGAPRQMHPDSGRRRSMLVLVLHALRAHASACDDEEPFSTCHGVCFSDAHEWYLCDFDNAAFRPPTWPTHDATMTAAFSGSRLYFYGVDPLGSDFCCDQADFDTVGIRARTTATSAPARARPTRPSSTCPNTPRSKAVESTEIGTRHGDHHRDGPGRRDLRW
jgi:hypothetical protein